jgi:hypothetical protein
MKKSLLFLVIACLITNIVYSQTQCSMYRFNKKIDYPVAALGIAGTTYGLYKRFQKPPSDTATILALSTEKMNKLDKGACETYNMGRISDVLFVLGVTSPWVLYSDKLIKRDQDAITMMYMQAITLSAAGYALTAGTVDKYRPYAYNPKAPMKRRVSTHAKNSFYCGHPSVMAAGAFFTAKTYSDYYPKSAKSYALWSYAALSTAACGYLRYKGGYHFPSDIAIGMTVGAAVGILVPVIHKNRNKESGVVAQPSGPDPGCQQVSFSFRF